MDELRGDTFWQIARATTCPRGDLNRVVANDALGEHLPVRACDLDGVIGVEASLHTDDAGREKRRLALDERPARTLVDRHGADRADGEGDPELSAPATCAASA